MRKQLSSPSMLSGMLIALVAFVAGTFAGQQLHREDMLVWLAEIAQLVPGAYTYDRAENIPAPTDLQPIVTFWEARNELRKRFYRPIKDDTVLTYGAIRGMLAALEDPYTRLMEPEEFKMFEDENEGNFEGIGAVLGVREVIENEEKIEQVVVQSVIEDGPAEKRGLRPKDIIIGVDGRSVRGLRLDQVVDRIRGKQGTTVTLTVVREGEKEPLEIPIVRDRIEYPVVEYEMRDGKIGYIWLRQFSRPATAKLRAALLDLLNQGMQGLVLDLSSNGGGLLDTAVEIESFFFDGGPAAYILERGAEEPEVLEASPGVLVPEHIPMVCLINEGSASASEILAGALQDRQRAKVVGQHSFGKSKVQTIVQLGDQSAMLVTTALWLTPAKRDVGEEHNGEVGVRPDIKFEEWTPETKLTGGEWHDQQVEKAIDVLKQEMAKIGTRREAHRRTREPAA
ncbi:MAG: S41 family peptidase [Candidatus Zipacnadales bacterium]